MPAFDFESYVLYEIQNAEGKSKIPIDPIKMYYLCIQICIKGRYLHNMLNQGWATFLKAW